jgi:hypothetical protein
MNYQYEYQGILFGWAETGTEGFYWALQWEKYIGEKYWDYKGLIVLDRKDHLTIYKDKECKEKVWSGVIEKDRAGISNVGINAHWFLKGFTAEQNDQWVRWFLSEELWGVLKTNTLYPRE